MAQSRTPVLHRDDPEKDPLVGHVKVTREDWLNLARNVLVQEGVGELKILSLSTRMGVSRSSFYWYFKNRADLLAALLDEWEARNTRTIVTHCEMPADDINAAVCNFFRCFVDPALFDRGLDFAVRDWARRDVQVNQRIEAADAQRLEAISAMFARFGYDAYDADIRARILYFMQIGYHAVELREPMEVRMSRLEGFLRGFTGREPTEDTIEAFRVFAMATEARP
ncbi:TetR/AcrR family transcriptional regulator [Marivita sp. S6314]|uniref:TetR/AcrR family transcriptional regulator n=1 Tax=Marivita sp. S6314 TaxID=2926406 RepID=UPI001FF1C6B8|nr:TetR/AcrR family transcriptional regulator [Marivita sp. S6314]MCK0151384.1 TetR/AcrR family transcriptional regulator [Marivita sp. S6314]